jgi:YggT family protein
MRAVFSLCTLYMMVILLRWLAPYLQVDVHRPRLRWIPALADPLIIAMRRILPVLGPFDFSPIAAILLVWVIRGLVTGLIAAVHFTS